MSRLTPLVRLGFQLLGGRITGRRSPIFLSLFVTNRCNLRCRYCFVVQTDLPQRILQAEYSFADCRRIIDEFFSLGTRMIFLLGGEPLVHPDIGRIIRYIVRKGIYLHVVTNGTLIGERIEDVRPVHALCVSLDGLEEANDRLRGKGSFSRAVAGIRASVSAGIPTRVHAVLNRHNLHGIRALAELCRDLRVALTISPPNFLDSTDSTYLRISDQEYRNFWREFLELGREGLPIANSRLAICKSLGFPKSFHQFIRQGEKFPGYDPVFCLNGHFYAALGAEGTMYNCINLGCLNGPNIHQLGIRSAWERLLDWRPDCVSCASINCIETAMLLNLNWETLREGFEFHLSSNVGRKR